MDMMQLCVNLNQQNATSVANKKGHIARACRSEPRDMKGVHTQLSQVPRQQKSSSGMHQITSSEEHVADIVHIHAVSQELPKSYETNITVNGIPLQMEIDTGAPVSIISESGTWENKLKQPTLKGDSKTRNTEWRNNGISDFNFQHFSYRNPFYPCITAGKRYTRALKCWKPGYL